MGFTLRALRVNKNLTQDQAGKLLGVTGDTVFNWEKGRSFPDVPHIEKIKDLYGVSYDDINFLLDTSV